MGHVGSTVTARRLMAVVALAVAAVVTTTTASADGFQPFPWKGTGIITYAGPSLDPSTPTTTKTRFKFDEGGNVNGMIVQTSNELVTGMLGDGLGGGALTQCQDRTHGEQCEQLDSLLTDAQIISFHNSTARVSNIFQHSVPVPGVGDVPVVSGSVQGQLQGVFTITDGAGTLEGTAKLRITEGSTATYACLLVTPGGTVPSTSLDPCINHVGGMMFPVLLDVQDTGRFEVGDGTGSLAGIESLKGRVNVHAMADLLNATFGGSIEIPKAQAQLGDLPS